MTCTLRETAATVRATPRLLGIGAAVATVEAAVFLVGSRILLVEPLAAPVKSVAGIVILQSLAVVAGRYPLLALYVACGNVLRGVERSGVDGEPLTDPFEAATRQYGRVVVATGPYFLAAAALAVPTAFALNSGFLVLDTAARASAYALGSGFEPVPLLTGAVFVGVTGAAVVLARVPFAFYDLLVLFPGDRPASAWRTSFRFAAARPRTVLRYGAVTGALLVPPAVLGFAITLIGPGPMWTIAGVVAYASVGGIARTLAGTYHVLVFEGEVADAVCGRATTSAVGSAEIVGLDGPLIARPRRLALAALLLTGLLVGSVGIRAADVRPEDTVETTPVDASTDPETALANGDAYTDTVSHLVTVGVDVNGSASGVRMTVRRDPAARKIAQIVTDESLENPSTLEAVFVGRPATRRAYIGEGTHATTEPLKPTGLLPEYDAFRRNVSGDQYNWTVDSEPAYVSRSEDWEMQFVPRSEAIDWRVVSESERNVVLGSENASDAALVGVLSGFFPEHEVSDATDDSDTAVEYAPDSHVRVTIERETGYVRYVEIHHNYTVANEYRNGTERVVITERIDFRNYGRVSVSRPEQIGDRTALEHVWDVLTY